MKGRSRLFRRWVYLCRIGCIGCIGKVRIRIFSSSAVLGYRIGCIHILVFPRGHTSRNFPS
jgi:hypothetical protein